MTDSFYTTGGSLRSDAPSYVERAADRELFEGLLGGEFCYVLTSRQMGKSSLTVRTAIRLREAGVQVVVLDLTALGQNLTADQWYYGLLVTLGDRLHLEDALDIYWWDHEEIGPLQRFMRALREIVLPALGDGRLVVFVDELDTVRSLPFSTDEFFAAIRRCYNARAEDPAYERLTFCLLGVATPGDLIRDTRLTPFNIGRRIDLADFTTEEARLLAAGLVVGEAGTPLRSDAEAKALLARVLYWTGGHPYLTQRLCRAVAADTGHSTLSIRNSPLTTRRLVDRHAEELFLSAQAREKDDNLLFVRERLLRSEGDGAAPDLAGLLELYGHVLGGGRLRPDDTNPLLDVLRLSGIVRLRLSRAPVRAWRRARSGFEVRNRIYRQVFDRRWIAEHMPDAEVRRQMVAFRRGVFRTAALAASLLAAMGSLAFFASQSAERAGRLAAERQRDLQYTRRLLYAANIRRAQDALAVHDFAGVLEALQATKPRAGEQDLRGFEWGYLLRAAHLDLPWLRGHSGVVYAASFSPDGTHVTTAGRDGLIKVWDAVTGRELSSVRLHGPEENWPNITGSISPDGRRVVTVHSSVATIWDALKGTPLLRTKTAARSAAFSPDGRWVVTGGLDNAAVWDALTGRRLSALSLDQGSVEGVAVAPDGRRVATWSDTAIRILGSRPGIVVLKLRSPEEFGPPDSACFSPDGRHLLTVHGGRAQIWDAANGRELRMLKTSRVFSATYSSDGRRVMTMDGNAVRVWDAASGRELVSLPGGAGASHSVALSPDGMRVITGYGDGSARIWDAARPRRVMSLDHGAEGVDCVSRDGTRGLVIGPFRTELWELASESKLQAFRGHGVSAGSDAALSRDGERILAGSTDNAAKTWEAATGRELQTFRGHRDPVTSVCFSPDGREVLTGDSAGTVKLWDSDTGRALLTLRAHTGEVEMVGFSPVGRRIVSVGSDYWAKIWDINTGAELHALTLPADGNFWRSAAFSPDGSRVLTASDGILRLWDPATGQGITVPKGEGTRARSCAFSPDSRQVLIPGGEDGVTHVCDAATGRVLAALRDRLHCSEAMFSPDGKRIVTYGLGRESTRDKPSAFVQFWEPQTGQALLSLAAPHGIPAVFDLVAAGERLVLQTFVIFQYGAGNNPLSVWDAAPPLSTLPAVPTPQGPEDRQVPTLVHRLELWNPRADLTSTAGFSPVDSSFAVLRPEGHVAVMSVAGSVLRELRRPGEIATCLAYSPDGRRLLTGAQNGQVVEWNLMTGSSRLVFVKPGEAIARVAWVGSERAVAGWPVKPGVWQSADAVAAAVFSPGVEQPICTFHSRVHPAQQGLAGSPDGNHVAAVGFGRTGATVVIDAATGRVVSTCGLRSQSVAFSPDGRWLALGNALWDWRTRERIRTFGEETDEGSGPQAFSRDGRLLGIGTGTRAQLWKVATGELLGEIQFPGVNSSVSSVGFSPDGRLMLAAEKHGVVLGEVPR